MTEWLIVLGVIATMLFVFACAICKSYLSMAEEMRMMKEKNNALRTSYDSLKKVNEELALSVYNMTAENNRLRNIAYGNEDAQRVSALRLELHLKQERIEELQNRLKEQRLLLRQKWEGSKRG